MFNKSYNPQEEKTLAGGLSQSIFTGRGLIIAISGAINFVIASMAIPARLFTRTEIGERSITLFSAIVMLALHAWIIGKIYFGVFISTGLIYTRDGSLSLEDLGQIASSFIINPLSMYWLLLFWVLIRYFRKLIQGLVSKEYSEYSFFRGYSKFFQYVDNVYEEKFLFEGRTIHSLNKDTEEKRIPLIFKLNKIMDANTRITLFLESKAVVKTGLKFFLASILLSIFVFFVSKSEEVGIGINLILCFGLVGIFIALSGLCFFIDELTVFLQRRGSLLDIKDGEIELNRINEFKDEMNNAREKQAEKADADEDKDFVTIP